MTLYLFYDCKNGSYATFLHDLAHCYPLSHRVRQRLLIGAEVVVNLDDMTIIKNRRVDHSSNFFELMNHLRDDIVESTTLVTLTGTAAAPRFIGLPFNC